MWIFTNPWRIGCGFENLSRWCRGYGIPCKFAYVRVGRGLLPSAWALRTGPLGEVPTLASCAKVRCLRSDDDGVKSREASSSNGLDDVRTSVGRRDVLNLALGLGSALLVGRWADKGSAAAAASAALPKKDPKSPFDEKRLLDQNRRMQKVNNAPEDFPNFIREGTFHTTTRCALVYSSMLLLSYSETSARFFQTLDMLPLCVQDSR